MEIQKRGRHVARVGLTRRCRSLPYLAQRVKWASGSLSQLSQYTVRCDCTVIKTIRYTFTELEVQRFRVLHCTKSSLANNRSEERICVFMQGTMHDWCQKMIQIVGTIGLGPISNGILTNVSFS